jgi:D-alanyl-D-alanine-carboxypeptidase/D-alanyl-D-alanine-endopeptidase
MHALLLCAALAAAAPDAGTSTQPLSALAPKVDEAIQPFLDAGWMKAVSVALVRGDEVFFRGYGGADATTLFEIGSVTKVFTGLCLADAVVRHQLSLADPLAKLLPADLGVPTYGNTPIRLEDLATQSSGLPRMPDNFHPAKPDDPYADYGAAALASFLKGYALPRPPGEHYEYSNLGFGTLGFALAHHDGTTFEQMVALRVTRPLGLDSTVVTLTPAQRPRLTPGHRADGSLTANWHSDALAGAGALLSDATDLARLIQYNLGVKQGPLTAALELARTPRRAAQAGQHIGLAWHVRDSDGTVWHNGGTGGYSTLVAFDPKNRTGIVLLSSQFAKETDALGFGLLEWLDGRAFTTPAPPKTVPLEAAVLEKLVGTYELKPLVYFKVARGKGGLTLQLTGQDPLRIFPSASTEFFLRDVEARVTFVLDDQGAPKALVLHQGGRDQTAGRIK